MRHECSTMFTYHPEMRVADQCHLLNRFKRFEKFLCVNASSDTVLSLPELFLETFHMEPFHAIGVTFDLLPARVLRDL